MKIKIHKFETIEDLTLEVPAAIIGGNGTGKTTILEAICFVLTGKDLSGNEFKQIYDNRVDLHDAIADVSYIDNYGNEYRRTVSPVFQTSRAGIEEIKIKRNTVCKKNDIAVNDFAGDFADFYTFGTDFFFRQKEDVQRAIFINTLKSRMPDYDIQSNSLRLKELVKSQKIAVTEIKRLRDLQKNTHDVEVPEISDELIVLNNEYLSLSAVDNSEAVALINRANNHAMSVYFEEKRRLNAAKTQNENDLLRGKNALSDEKTNLKKITESVFTPKLKKSTDELEAQIAKVFQELEALNFYESIEDYAQDNFLKNTFLVSNGEKIKKLLASEFVPTSEISDACPLSGEVCETARLHSESSLRLAFNKKKEAEIEGLRLENRSILSREMEECNEKHLAVKKRADNLQRELAEISESNLKIDAENAKNEKEFDALKKSEIERITKRIELIEKSIADLENTALDLIKKLEALTEPTPEKLPEDVEISEELKAAHAQFEAESKKVTGATAINENNAKNRALWESEIKETQANLFEIDGEVTRIKAEISDYFSNLKNLVQTEFAGEIEIGVELLEYVMSRDEYKDCFRITANGKAFPFECNGALQNNTKLQVLSTFQRLNGYTGITIMDNCEANTTQKINTCGLSCVLATANMDEKLSIQKL